MSSTEAHYRALAYLQTGEPATIAAITKALKLHRTNVHKQLDKLEREGLITTTIVPVTGRVAALTDKGAAKKLPPFDQMKSTRGGKRDLYPGWKRMGGTLEERIDAVVSKAIAAGTFYNQAAQAPQ